MRRCVRRRTPVRAGPGRGDPMIAYITAAETERLTLDQAFARMPDDFPGLRTFASQRLQSDEQLAEMLESERAARLFVVRILGGRPFFEKGYERIAEHCRSRRLPLLAVPGDQQPDPELAALSNIPLADQTQALEYLVDGGVENYENLLRYLSDVYLSTALGFDAPPARSPTRVLPSGGRGSARLRGAVARGVPQALLEARAARDRSSVLPRALAKRKSEGGRSARRGPRPRRLERVASLLL